MPAIVRSAPCAGSGFRQNIPNLTDASSADSEGFIGPVARNARTHDEGGKREAENPCLLSSIPGILRDAQFSVSTHHATLLEESVGFTHLTGVIQVSNGLTCVTISGWPVLFPGRAVGMLIWFVSVVPLTGTTAALPL